MKKNFKFVQSKILVAVLAFVFACLPLVCFADDSDSASDDLYQFTLGNSYSGLGFNPYYCIFDGVLDSYGNTDSGTHQNTFYYNYPFNDDVELVSFDVDFQRDYSSGHLYIDGTLSYYLYYDDGSYYFSYIPALTSSSTGTISAVSSSTFDTLGYFYQFYTVFPSALTASLDDSSCINVYLDISAVGAYYSTPNSVSVGLNFYDPEFNLLFKWSSSGSTSSTSWSGYSYTLTDLAYSGWTSFNLGNYDTAAFDNVSYVGVTWELFSTSSTAAKEIIYVSDSGISYNLMALNSAAVTFSNYTVADALEDGYISYDDTYCCCNCDYWLEQILAQTVTMNDNLNTIIENMGNLAIDSSSIDMLASASDSLASSSDSLNSSYSDYSSVDNSITTVLDSDDYNIDNVDFDVSTSILAFSNGVTMWVQAFSDWTDSIGSLWSIFMIGLIISLILYIIRILPRD